MRYLSGIFWGQSWTLVHWFQIILNFLYVCQSGSWYTSLMKSDKSSNISSSGWDIFLNVYTLVQNNSDFLTWNSNISILPGWNLLHLYTIVLLVGHLLRPLVLLLLVQLCTKILGFFTNYPITHNMFLICFLFLTAFTKKAEKIFNWARCGRSHKHTPVMCNVEWHSNYIFC